MTACVLTASLTSTMLDVIHAPDANVTREPGVILNRIGGFTALAVAAAGVFFWFYHQSQKRRERIKNAKHKRNRLGVVSLSLLPNTMQSPIGGRSLSSKDVLHNVYSAELTPVFVRQDQRPLLFMVSVKDVTRQGSEYTIHAEAKVNILNPIKLQLRATPEQAKTVMAGSDDSLARYAIVARIDSVSESNQNSQNSEESHSRSLAEGECMGVLPVGRYIGDILDLIRKRSRPN